MRRAVWRWLTNWFAWALLAVLVGGRQLLIHVGASVDTWPQRLVLFGVVFVAYAIGTLDQDNDDG